MGQALSFRRPPLQKILPPKIFGFEFCEPHPPRARSARRAAESVVFFVGGQRKPLRIESCLCSGDSIQPRSNPFYQPLMSRAPRAWWLCTGVVRFDSVLTLSGARVRRVLGPRPAARSSILIHFAGVLKIEWAAGRIYSAFQGAAAPPPRQFARWLDADNMGYNCPDSLKAIEFSQVNSEKVA